MKILLFFSQQAMDLEKSARQWQKAPTSDGLSLQQMVGS